jgi:hypothetical protein
MGRRRGIFCRFHWIGLDVASFKSWLIHLDASKTGAAFAVCIAAWVSALWVTRHWARTDRDFYRSELQKAYAQASALIRSAVEVDTDQQWGHIKQAIDEFEKMRLAGWSARWVLWRPVSWRKPIGQATHMNGKVIMIQRPESSGIGVSTSSRTVKITFML